MTYPGMPCNIAPLANWTTQERWVWREICEGRMANLNEYVSNGLWFDPTQPDSYPQNKVLTPNFIKTILLYEPFNKSIPSRGVCIVGARFEESLDLSNTKFEHDLWLLYCKFDRNVDFSGVTTASLISFESSTFEGDVLFNVAKIGKQLNFSNTQFNINSSLNMYGIKVVGDLFMRFGAKFNRIELTRANIDGSLEMMGSIFMDEVFVVGSTISGQLNVSGSYFVKKLDLDSTVVSNSVIMRNNGIYNKIDLRGAKIGYTLEITGNSVDGELLLNGTTIGHSLVMKNRGRFTNIIIRTTEIGSNIEMDSSTFDGLVDINSVKVGGSIFIREGARLKGMNLISVLIGGQLNFDHAKIGELLHISSVNIDGGLRIKNKSICEKIVINDLKAKGQISLEKSIVRKALYIESAKVEGDFYLQIIIRNRNTICRVIFSDINGNLDITNSFLPSLDLTGTNIRKDFRLGAQNRRPVRWRRNSKLILRNTDAEAIQDSADSWPREVELDGFTYTKLGGLLAGDDDDMVNRDIKWFKQWLGEGYVFQPYKHLERILPNIMRLSPIRKYSPQPYEQLAKVLRNMGYPDKANAILYSGKKREMSETSGLLYFWLLLQDVVIGFSYRIWYSLIWIVFLVVLGFVIFNNSTIAANYNTFDKIFFSLDMLLPIIELSKDHEEILSNCLIGFPKYYFYIQQILGYVLASFIIGGLTKFIYKP